MRKSSVASIAAVLMLVLTSTRPVRAEELRVWTTRAIATVLAEIGPQFERATGHRLDVYSGLPDDFEKRLKAGVPLDLLISGSAPVDEWIKQGRLVAATRTGIARSGIGVEVRAGARKPDMWILTPPSARTRKRRTPRDSWFSFFRARPPSP